VTSSRRTTEGKMLRSRSCSLLSFWHCKRQSSQQLLSHDSCFMFGEIARRQSLFCDIHFNEQHCKNFFFIFCTKQYRRFVSSIIFVSEIMPFVPFRLRHAQRRISSFLILPIKDLSFYIEFPHQLELATVPLCKQEDFYPDNFILANNVRFTGYKIPQKELSDFIW